MTATRTDGTVRWWATWRPFWFAWLATAVLLPLVSWGAGVIGSRLPLVILFPFAAVVATAVQRTSLLLPVVLLGQLPAYALFARAGARRHHPRAAGTAILLLHLAAVGLGGPMSWGPSLAAYKRCVLAAAGPEARDCGVVPLGQDRGAAVACARAALAEARPFSVAFQVMGIDSTIYVRLAHRTGGQATRILWDSDVTGGYNLVPLRRIHQEACTTPTIADAERTSPISCGERRDGAVSE